MTLRLASPSWISSTAVDAIQYQIKKLKDKLTEIDDSLLTLTNSINTNATNIQSNAEDITTNAANIATNTDDIATNAANITTNAANITTNAANITTNAANIATNTANIATNQTSIATLQSLISQAVNADDQTLTALFNNDSDLIQLLYDDQAGTYTISLRKHDGSYTTVQDMIDAINGLVDSVNSISNPNDEANLGEIVDTANDAFDIFSGLGDFASAGAGFIGGLIASSLNTSKADGLFLLNWINVLRLSLGTVINLLETEIIHRFHQDRAIKIYSRNTINGSQLNLVDGEAYVYDSTYKLDVEGNQTTELDSRAIVFQGEEILTLGNELTQTELDQYVFGNTTETITEPDGTTTTNTILRDYKNIFKGKALFIDDVTLPNYYTKTEIDGMNFSSDSVWNSTSTEIYYNNGNVGIGTDQPTDLLDVNGCISVSGGTSGYDSNNTVDETNRGRTYFALKQNGTTSDWCYIRQLNTADEYKLSFDFHNDAECRLALRKIYSLGNPDTGFECFTFNDYIISIHGRDAIRGNSYNDTFLRLNESGDFTSGVYTRYNFRCDGVVSLSGKIAFTGNDTYLRLNNNQQFSSGVYTPLNLRVDGILNIGGGKEGLRGGTTQLILNNNNDFTAGVYTPYDLRVDGILNIGGGKEGLRGATTQLILNNNNDFTDGVYTPYNFEAGSIISNNSINIENTTNKAYLTLTSGLKFDTYPLLWYRFDDSTDLYKNYGSAGRDYDLTGTGTINSDGTYGDGCISLSSSQTLQVDISGLNLNSSANGTTVCGWFRRSSWGPLWDNFIGMAQLKDSNNQGQTISLKDGEYVFYGIITSSSYQGNVKQPSASLAGEWFFIAMRQYTNGGTIYNTLNTSHNTGGSLTLGARTTLTLGSVSYQNENWGGDIDDFRVYNRVLSDAQLNEIYNRKNGTIFYPEDFQPTMTFKNIGGTENIGLYIEKDNFVISNSSDGGNDIIFKTGSVAGYANGSERLRIKSNGDVEIEGNLTVKGTFLELNQSNDLSINGNLSVAGTSTLTGAVSCGNNLSVTGSLSASVDISCPQIYLAGGTTTFSSGQVDSGNRTQTYITFKENGTNNDWAYIRQIGGDNAFKLALDMHDDGEARFCIRMVNSVNNPDTITEVFTVDGGSVSFTGNCYMSGSIRGNIGNFNKLTIPNNGDANFDGNWDIYMVSNSSGMYGAAVYDLFFQYGSLDDYGEQWLRHNDDGNDDLDFTGSHRCIAETSNLLDEITSNLDYYQGMLVSTTGYYQDLNRIDNDFSSNIRIDSSLPIIKLTDIEKDKAVYGVISNVEGGDKRIYKTGRWHYSYPKLDANRIMINAVGEGAIWTTNYPSIDRIENGDYLCSSPIKGYSMKQSDDLLHNYTVAKTSCSVDFVDEDSDWYYKNFKHRFETYQGVQYIAVFIGCSYHCS